MSENYWRRLRQGKLNRRRFLAGTGVAAAGTAAILAGCSDDDDSSSASATAAATSAATSAAATSAAATEAAAAATEAAAAEDRSRYGGTLRLWKDQEDVGLDPAVFHGPNNEVVNYCFTNGLTYQVTKNEFGLDGLAAMEQIDATSTVWTLREGMTFNNGDPVTAEDYAYSIRRVKEIYDERQSHATGNLFNYMDTVEAIDDFTVKETYTLPVPNPPLHRWRQYFGMVNKAVVEAEPLPEGSALHDGQNYPAGMSGGAYLLDKRDATGTSLVVNPNYFRHENPGPSSSFNVDRPYIDQIDTRILADAASRKAAFIAGELDVYGTMDFYDAEELGAYDHINILEAPTAAVAIYGFDNEQFYDNRARRAIRAAMDFDGFRASFWPNGSNLQAPIDIRIAAYQGLTQQDLAKWYVYDPADAKALWDAYVSDADPDDVMTEVVFLAIAESGGVPIAEFGVQGIKSVLGIDSSVETNDFATWAARANARAEGTGLKDYQILMSGDGKGGGTSGDPNDSNLQWYNPAFYAGFAFNVHNPDGPAGGIHSKHQENKDDSAVITDFYERQAVEFDTEARKQILTEMQTYILDKAYLGIQMPAQANSMLGVHRRLQNVPAGDFLNSYSMRHQTMWIDDSLS